MLQDKSYKNRLLMVNSSVIGPKERLNNPQSGHPMIRTWPGADPFRAVAGYYSTVYQSSKGATLVNYASLINQINEGGSPGHYDHAGAPGGRLSPPTLRDQLYNIVLQISPANSTLSWPLEFIVQGSLADWNAFENRDNASTGWLGDNNGDNFNKYLHGSYSVPAGPQTGLFNQTLSSSRVVADIVQDYTCVFYSISSDKHIRAASGIDLNIQGEYNYYVSTTPNYEIITADPGVSEGLLPNVYIMYSELQNTGSTLLADYHYSALSIPGSGPGYFTQPAQTQGGVTERNTVGAYQLWATGLSTPAGPDDASFDIMKVNNTNFVILHSDEAITNSEYIKNEMIPYCVKITMPPDQHATTGIRAPASFLINLANNKNTKYFIDVLQTAAINRHLSLGPGNPGTQNFTTTARKPLSAADASNYELSTEAANYPILCDVNTEFKNYMNQLSSPGPVDLAASMFGHALQTINSYGEPVASLESLPYRFLKDYGRTAYNPFTPIEDPAEHIANAQVELSGTLMSWSRTYPEMIAGVPCHTETLMYVISKYLLNDDGSQPDNPVQTFYISNKLAYKNLGNNESIPITFYDSQVKYEKKYRYIIHKMVVVVGNEYYYTEVPLAQRSADLDAQRLRKRIKAHNRPNIKVMMVPYVAGGLDCLVVDRPPVPPEMSFYLHKGISNKIQILLNSNTGRYDQPPIEILNTDAAFFEKEYLAQNGEELPFSEIVSSNKKISFSSDDLVDRYQLFRLQHAPDSYKSFASGLISAEALDPVYGTPSSYIDPLIPNNKYYYCARSIDIHGNISNPTTIIVVEVVDNEGKIYLIQKPYTFKTTKQRLIKSGRRFILIEPALRQSTYNTEGQSSTPALNITPTKPLGASNLEDSIWNKQFKVRFMSRQTGRKIDLNINFKNSGIVKGSE
tara:strand:+ start:47039 stop:49771 length:2733 start_codon:yes stop_codon:yes gene_type:complete